MSIEIQYTILAVIIALCLGWMLRGIIRISRNKNKSGGCPGCALSDSCKKKKC
ncbi:MAG: FeoB-associated Cys-rich membrane protein [Bacteroidales bacterium]|nr:FeoB-associated Cys-rich membrane protein [Bacteroidales bacterium]